MRRSRRRGAVLGSLLLAVLGAACEEGTQLVTTPPDTVLVTDTLTLTDTVTVTVVRTDTVTIGDAGLLFPQVERLGNPLAMEVFVEKRFHGQHDASPPTRDPGTFTDDYVEFVTQVAGRSEDYARAIAGALLGSEAQPGDKILVFTNRAPGVTASVAHDPAAPGSGLVGWLSWVLAPGEGWGGRKLRGDDVVDKGSAVVFGDALGNTEGVSPGLVTDNVGANDRAPLAEFPWFPPPHP